MLVPMSGSISTHSSAKSDDPTPSWKNLTDALPPPRDQADRDDLLWQQFEAQFRWYHRGAGRTRVGYQSLRLVVLITGAAVTVLAARGAEPWLTASLAAVVVAVEGAQQLFQFHVNWIRYRSTAETLRQHGMLYAAQAEPYNGQDRRVRLARLLREVTSKESEVWVSRTQQSASSGAKPAP